jgi:hypothetical protein
VGTVTFHIPTGPRGWRGNPGLANAWVERVEADMLRELERVPDWGHETLLRIARSWHPCRHLVAMLTGPRDEKGIQLIKVSKDPAEGSPSLYRQLEDYGGRLPRRFGRNWLSGNQARDRFALISACLIYAELEERGQAVSGKDEAGIWLAMYWIGRFYGNLIRVRADTMQRKSAGHKGGVQKFREARANAQRVSQAYARLDEVDRGRPAVGLIAEATRLSKPTVRGHLVALGLRKPKAESKRA